MLILTSEIAPLASTLTHPFLPRYLRLFLSNKPALSWFVETRYSRRLASWIRVIYRVPWTTSALFASTLSPSIVQISTFSACRFKRSRSTFCYFLLFLFQRSIRRILNFKIFFSQINFISFNRNPKRWILHFRVKIKNFSNFFSNKFFNERKVPRCFFNEVTASRTWICDNILSQSFSGARRLVLELSYF